ncbi:B12-binding domain-containing protein [Jeotgalibacillus proteolyticus]|nr:B12-binding domain-containing protein [Jeotgalibacillus proteolyticus]
MSSMYVNAFTDALLAGDQEKSWSVINEAVFDGCETKFIFHFITPSMVEIGRLWQENKITVADEHLKRSEPDERG